MTAELYAYAADLAEAPRRVQALAVQAMTKTLVDISADAKTFAPVDTGFLRGSISHSIAGRGATVRGEVGPTANYAAYVENGTSRQRAQPYLRPATDRRVPGYEEALAQISGEAL